MKRYYDQGNSYEGKHLIGTGFQFKEFSPLLSWQEEWQHAADMVTGERVESSTSGLAGSRK